MLGYIVFCKRYDDKGMDELQIGHFVAVHAYRSIVTQKRYSCHGRHIASPINLRMKYRQTGEIILFYNLQIIYSCEKGKTVRNI